MILDQKTDSTDVLDIDGHCVTIHFSSEAHPETFRRVREILLSSCKLSPEQAEGELDKH